MKSLKLKALILAAGLVAASLSTSASATNIVATLETDGSYSFGNTFTAGTFSDVVSGFNISASEYNGSILALTKSASKKFTFNLIEIYNSANTLVSTVTDIRTNGTSAVFANSTGLAAADTYTLHLAYTATGAGRYDGSVLVSSVPEPETYGMMLAGLGLMGFVARRRKSV